MTRAAQRPSPQELARARLRQALQSLVERLQAAGFAVTDASDEADPCYPDRSQIDMELRSLRQALWLLKRIGPDDMAQATAGYWTLKLHITTRGTVLASLEVEDPNRHMRHYAVDRLVKAIDAYHTGTAAVPPALEVMES